VEKVHNPNNATCNTPLAEPFEIKQFSFVTTIPKYQNCATKTLSMQYTEFSLITVTMSKWKHLQSHMTTHSKANIALTSEKQMICSCNYESCMGSIMAQLVSCQPLTAEVWLQSHVNTVDKVATGQVSLKILQLSLPISSD
jgi:hypothetical protein